MIETRSPLARLSVSFRALGLLALGGAAVGFAIGLAGIRGPLDPFFTANQLGPAARRFALSFIFGGAVAFAVGGVGFLWRGRSRAEAAGILYDSARRLSPLYLVCFPVLLFRRQVWQGRELAFVTMVAFFVLAAWAATTAAMRAPPFRVEARLTAWAGRCVAKLDPRGRVRARVPFGLVLGGALLYVACLCTSALRAHFAVRSGPELALADHLTWNALHGGSIFKSSLGFAGPGTSGGPHAVLVAYALAPLYALYQHATSLLVLRAVLIGGAALPLYALARRHVAPLVAAIVALAYLLYPALQVRNPADFQFLFLGPIFLWSAWALLAAGRPAKDVLAAIFIALTLMVREDTVLWIFVLGAYFILTGRRPLAGLAVVAAGAAWLVALKVVVLPRMDAADNLVSIYGSLVPPGKRGVGSVLATVADNPALIASTLADMPRLVYLFEILLPLAFLPLRRPLWLLFFLPGFLLTLLPADVGGIRSLGSPSSAHWVAFLFPAAVLGIEALQRRAPSGTRPQVVALFAIMCATAPLSYQFGADRLSPVALPGQPRVSNVDQDARRRYGAIRDLVRALPARAKVAASHWTAAMLSNRPDAGVLAAGVADAAYLVFPTQGTELVDNERWILADALRNGGFGVLMVREPFAVAKRGYSTAGNAALTARW